MNTSTKTSRFTRAALAFASLTSAAACSDGTRPNGDGQVGVGFQLATASVSANVLAESGVTTGTGVAVNANDAGLTISRGTDNIVITKAQLVIRDVKLKTATATCSDDSSSSDVAADNNGKSKDDNEDERECPTIRVGPYLVTLPVSGLDAGRVTVAVPAGTYSRVRLTVHKVTSSDSADLAFRQANPDFRDISVRLEGTYNGTPFTFVNDVEAKLDVPLTSPLTIKDGGDNVTVLLDVAPWFVNSSGGLYNPAEANTPGLVRAKVQNAIRSAFRAFRDRNRDGKED